MEKYAENGMETGTLFRKFLVMMVEGVSICTLDHLNTVYCDCTRLVGHNMGSFSRICSMQFCSPTSNTLMHPKPLNPDPANNVREAMLEAQVHYYITPT